MTPDTDWIGTNDYISSYKKVLLRERKRHTARRVVSTPSVVLTPPSWPGGVPCWGVPYLGTLQQGTPYPGRGVPYLGTPWQGTPHPDLARGYPTLVPPWQGTPQLDLAGYPPGWTWQGTPPRCLSHGILGNGAKHYGIWVPPQVWTD